MRETTTVHSLPDELLLLIISLSIPLPHPLDDSLVSFSLYRAHLRSCTLVHPRWTAISQPLLFRHVAQEVGNLQEMKVYKKGLLSMSEYVLGGVRTLVLSAGRMGRKQSEIDENVRRIVRGCKGLQELSLMGLDVDIKKLLTTYCRITTETTEGTGTWSNSTLRYLHLRDIFTFDLAWLQYATFPTLCGFSLVCCDIPFFSLPISIIPQVKYLNIISSKHNRPLATLLATYIVSPSAQNVTRLRIKGDDLPLLHPYLISLALLELVSCDHSHATGLIRFANETLPAMPVLRNIVISATQRVDAKEWRGALVRFKEICKERRIEVVMRCMAESRIGELWCDEEQPTLELDLHSYL